MIKAVVFDMDGVLLDSERVFLEAWIESARVLGLDAFTREMGLMSVGLPHKECTALYAGLFSIKKAEELGNLCNKLAFESFTKHVPVKPGVPECLAALKSMGLTLALATSTGRNRAQDNLIRGGLLDYFSVLLCGDDITRYKPDPQIYLLAAEQLGLKPEECVAVEDSPVGLKAAKAAGMKAVLIRDLLDIEEEIRSQADYYALDMSETCRYIRGLVQKN